MTIKELAAVTPETTDIFIVFGGVVSDEIVYSSPLAAMVNNLIVDKIVLDIDIEGHPQIKAIIKMQPITEKN